MGNLPIKPVASMGFAWMIIGILACFIFCLLPSSVQGLKCYECFNGKDKNCMSDQLRHPTKFEKECAPGAIACLHYLVHGDYVIGKLDRARTCVYPGDMKCLIGTDDVTPSEYKQSHYPFYYKTAMDCWLESRSKLNLSLPPYTESMVADQQHTQFWYLLTKGDLSNSKPEKHLTDNSPEAQTIIKTPESSDHFCYSCDATEVSTKFNYEEKDHEDKGMTLIPSCNGKEKQIYCRDSLGCSAYWETRRGAGGELTTRISRGCWKLNHQRCLRKPTLVKEKDKDKEDKKDKKGGEGTGNNSTTTGKDCEALLKKGGSDSGSRAAKARQGYEVYGLAWSGLKTIPNFDTYNEYMNCFHGFWQGDKQLPEEERPAKSDNKTSFARIRYYFCRGYSETRCNIWNGMTATDVPELPPVPPPPPKESRTIEDSRESPNGQGGTYPDNCYETGEKNGGTSLLSYNFFNTGISSLPFISVISHRFTLFY